MLIMDWSCLWMLQYRQSQKGKVLILIGKEEEEEEVC